MKLASRRVLTIFSLTALVYGALAFPRLANAKVSPKHHDRLLFRKAMCAADIGKFQVANLSLHTLINTYPNSKYAKKAKLALEDPRIARCGEAWNSFPDCDGKVAPTAPAETSLRQNQCVMSQFQFALGIQPGMTRSDLLEVFTMEGGLSNRLRQTYVLKGCEIIHVDVTYSFISNDNGHFTEMPNDKIKTISKPYLDSFHAD